MYSAQNHIFQCVASILIYQIIPKTSYVLGVDIEEITFAIWLFIS